jgi:heme A synthase
MAGAGCIGCTVARRDPQLVDPAQPAGLIVRIQHARASSYRKAMSSQTRRAGRFAWSLAAVVLVLIGLGGVVHTTGSSLACPDWPLCNGQWMPEMRGGVEFEHSHRLLALAVALGALALPILIPRALVRARRAAAFAVVLVATQAMLGAATVWLRLPPPVSIAHLLTATLFLAILVVLGARLVAPAPLSVSPHTVTGLDVTVGLLVLQIGLGACVRHLQAMYACGDDPWGCAPLLQGSAPALLQVVHRANGYVVALLVVALVGATEAGTPARRAALVPLVLVVTQLGLGLAAIALVMPTVLVTSHLVCAELLLASLLLLRVRARSELHAAARDASHTAPA